MQKGMKYLAFSALIICALFIIISSSDNAAADSHYWDNGGGDGKISTGTNWDPDNPVANDTLIWGAVSTANCAADTATYYNWVILSNYTGTITQGSVHLNIGTGGYTQQGGNLAANYLKNIYCYGSFVQTGGHIPNPGPCFNLFMMQDGTTANFNEVDIMNSLIIKANVTFTNSAAQTYFGASAATSFGINVDSGKTLTISDGKILGLVYPSGLANYQIAGNLAGPGTFRIVLTDASKTFGILGQCTSKLDLKLSSSGSASRTLTFNTNISASTIDIYSSHATNTFTVKTDGYSITSYSTSIGIRGILDADTSALYCSYLFDASNGTYIPDTSTLFISDGGAAKFASVMPNNMQLAHTGLSDIFRVTATSGTLFWNVTGLTASTSYGIYIDSSLSSVITTIGTTQAFSRASWSTHTYEMRQVPIITGSPSLTIAELVTYSSTLTADQAGTWTMTTNATFLSFDAGTQIVSGTADSFDGGHSYYISIKITNTNGIDYENWTLTVSNDMPGFNTDPVLVGNAGWNYEYRVGTDLGDNGSSIIYFLFTSNTDLKFSNTTKIVSGIFTDSGSVNCSISAMDAHGSKIWQNWTIIVGGYRWNPAVSIIYHVDAVTLTVTFDPRFQDNRTITGVMWNFGDGNGSKEEAPMHRYAAPGTYTVTLAAFDKWGNMGWFTTDITVGSEAPISVEERTEWWLDNQASGAILVFIGALVIASLYVGVIGPRKGGAHWAIMLLIGAVALVLIMQIYGVIA